MDILQFKSELNFNYNNDQEIIDKMIEIYSFQGYKPSVKIEGDIIHIHIDNHVLDNTQRNFDKACELCNGQKFDKAIALLEEVVKVCPLHVDAYRMIAQAYMMLGDLDKAMDNNIEALRIDAGNLWALVLMGNILSRKNDVEGAMLYYQKVLKYHPNDFMALNNVGGALMEQGKYDEAIEMFEKCLAIDKTYMNAYYGMALAYFKKNNPKKAMEIAREGVSLAIDRKENPQVREELLKLMLTSAMNLADDANYMDIIAQVKSKLTKEFNADIRFENDRNLNLSAVLQYAKAHRRDYHLVKYNGNKKYNEHFMLHELMHLQMNLAASKQGANKLMGYNEICKKKFMTKYAKYFSNLSVKIGKDKVNEFAENLFKGFSLQLMNCPLDLLVEDLIYNNYPEAHPLQLLSLFEQEQENIKSIAQGLKNPGMFPNQILRASKIMNMVTSLHLKELYGLNFLHYYKPNQQEMKEAEDLYEEYKAYRADYKPGEEYDMVMYFIEQLNCEDFFEVFNENVYDSIHEEKVAEKTGLSESERMKATDDFNEQHKDGEDPAQTFMMSMYMLGAMEYFEGMPMGDIKKIAFEIAMLGCGGISPDQKSGYKVNSIPDKDFGGYQLLAYYYVSWAIAIPEQLDMLQLPFKKAYECAKQMYDAKKNK